MTTFEDGPANGQTLMLKRAARFLRVVECAGKFDALDQPEDTPHSAETIYAYEVIEKPCMCHLNAGGGRGGFYPVAMYRFIPEQPSDADMRDTDKWAYWCDERAKSHPRNDL